MLSVKIAQSAKHQFSADDILKYVFLLFSQKLDLTFHANFLQYA